MKRPPPRLTVEDLAHFTRPIAWPEIRTIEPLRSRRWWSEAVLEADEYGRALLMWIPCTKSWVLTERGRALVHRELVIH